MQSPVLLLGAVALLATMTFIAVSVTARVYHVVGRLVYTHPWQLSSDFIA